MILTHHGIDSLRRSGGGGVIDPSIVLLFDGVSNYGYQPTSGIINPTIHYDANGPLDVSGTGWAGTPYVINQELGGNATNLAQLHDNNHGIHWNQAGLLALDVLGGEFTLDFWAMNLSTTIRGNSPSVMFSNGSDWILMLTKWYGASARNSLYMNGSESVFDTIVQNSNVWHHFAVVQKYGKIKIFIDGYFVHEFNDFSRNNQNIFTICSEYSQRGGSNTRYAQVCVRNAAKWTNNFTPPTRPYILGD